ncbi:MAG: M28 family peptidase, partial [Candidatus Thorarchaeota archaeon]|nr:M28 family peptidase [Candidatus Thorarchaeota archaeon]
MRGTWSRVFTAVLMLSLLLGPMLATTSGNMVPEAAYLIDRPIPSDITYFNATALVSDIWTTTSQDNIGNLTKDLTENFPSRIWDEEGPNQNLTDAWDWANTVLQANTDDELTFQQVTEYQSLLAIKSGTGPAPRPVIVLSGVIDSEDSPGTNDAGAGVAAVLEIARVLHNYTLSYDVYYVLLNGMHLDEDYDLGGRAFVQWLEENNIQTLTGIAFDRILFHRAGYLYGFKISIRSDSTEDLYHDEDWIPQFMALVSSGFGKGFIQQVPDLGIAQRSMAYEMWQVGRPAMHIAQGYQYDPLSSTDEDTWDNPDLSFEKAADLAASTAAIIAYIGLIGTGVAPERSRSGVLAAADSEVMRTIVNKKGYLNATITWDGNSTLQATIIDLSEGTVIYNRIEVDNLIVMKYLVSEYGSYAVNVTNLGVVPTNYTLTITAHEDIDGDTLTDLEELDYGTSPYLRDSDQDQLDDDFEIAIGTNPTSDDSDGDGASDYDEFIWGSSLLSNDTDGDLIGDGLEASLGTDPTSEDTDLDGLGDYLEVYVTGTNPLSVDSDLDGLEDGFEYDMGLDPLSPDTDGDSLSDLFEVLN